MAEQNLSGYYTMVDIASEYNDKQLLYIAKTLSRQNDILQDAPYTEANQIFSHKGSRDGTLPSPGFRKFNEGTAATTAKSIPVIEGLAIMEDWGWVDEEEYKIQPQKEAWRQRKDSKHIEGMSQKGAYELFYGNVATDPAGFNGLAVRYASLTTRPNGDTSWPYNVVNVGGSGGDTTSIYIIEWDPDECALLYPRGSKAGIEFEDMGRRVSEDTNGKRMVKLESHFLWKFALWCSDDRRVQRVANIEVSGSSNLFDEDYLIDAILNTPSRGKNRSAIKIYCNASVMSQMWKKLKDKNNVYYTAREGLAGAGPVLDFNGYPIRLCDAIVNTETAAA